MKLSRMSVIGGIAYAVLASLWFLGRNQVLSNANSNPSLQTIADNGIVILGAVVLVAVIIANAVTLKAERRARQRASETLLRQRSYVNALAHTAAQVNLERRLSVVLPSICGEAAICMGMDAGMIALRDPERRTLEPAASFGLTGEAARLFTSVSYEPADFRATPVDIPMLLPISNQTTAARLHGHVFRAGGYASVIHLPLLDGDEVLGTFNLLSRAEVVELTPEQVAAFRSFAAQAALAVRNDRLMADTHETRSRLDSLHTGDLAILSSLDVVTTLNVFLQKVIEHLRADAADVLLLNPAGQTLEYAAGIGFHTNKLESSKVALGTGFSGRIALERASLFVPDVNMATPFPRRELMLEEGIVTYYGAPLIGKGRVLGVLEVYQRRAFQPDRDWASFLEILASQAAIAIDNATLYSELQQANRHLSLAYDRTLEGWSRALDLRDRETEGHTERVTDLCLQLAKRLDVPEQELVHMRRGALLHDIGKMGVPDQVLLKPGQFTEEDRQIMRGHPTLAFEMLAPISFLQPALDIPYGHHERWDGSGYPRGLKGEAIPLAARIFAVVDVWDAMTSNRPYREALSQEEAFQYLQDQAGKQFDPVIVERFLKLIAARNQAAPSSGSLPMPTEIVD